MRTITDQMGRIVNVPETPKRIISLVPSQTELLYDLGMLDEVVGQTLFCIHPKTMHLVKPRVGGTKNLNLDKIRTLNPDLIIGNKEENDKQQIEQLMSEFPVWMSDIQNLDDALKMINSVADLVGRKEEGAALVNRVTGDFKLLKSEKHKIKCLYLIWRNPYLAAGKDTFINDMLNRNGWNNLAAGEPGRYPELTLDRIKSLNPNLVLLSSEPYPFSEKHLQEIQLLLPETRILLVDGESFSWYGSRLLRSAAYFIELQRTLAT